MIIRLHARLQFVACLLAAATWMWLGAAGLWAHPQHGDSEAQPSQKAREKPAPAPSSPTPPVPGAPQPFAASELPDRIVLTWTGDPARSIAVIWRTAASVGEGWGQIAPAGDGPTFTRHARQVKAQTVRVQTDRGVVCYHTVRFEGLEPGTKYAYRVGDGAERWSEWNQFRTAAAGAEPFTFVYFGDAQNLLRSMWSRVVREAFADAPRAAFFLHAGDLVNRGNRDVEWGQWFYAGGFAMRMIPTVATPGNHEYVRLPGGRGLTPLWRPQFAFPEHGPPGLEETVYYIDYQGVRIISLNSNEKHREQAAWLEKVLAENPNRWTIITYHHPMYSASRGRDNPHLRRLWQGIFDRYGVDLVLQGHDHTYARSRLMTAADTLAGKPSPEPERNVPTGTAARSPGGTVYVVSVSGPKMYRLAHRPYMRRAAENTQLYQIITVDGFHLRYEARTAAGRLYDAFLLQKRPGRPNHLVELVPEVPQRLRRLGTAD